MRLNDWMPVIQRDIPIPLSDGIALSGDLWLPDAPQRVPAVVRLTAYRKDDLDRAAGEHQLEYFADRGYAGLLVDLRGLGASAGIADEAISPREGSDGAEIVEWAAHQPWCDGSVGIWGSSWGAVTAFRVAAAQPPHLKAVAAIMGFLDAYRDWVYPGGRPTCLVTSNWACGHLLQQLMPPASDDRHDDWLGRWADRLDHVRPYLAPWRERPHRDAYWRDRAVDAGRIEVPTFLIGGWRDMCCEGTIRAYERLAAPRRLLMGPWGHVLPDAAANEPVDYLHLLCRWWDRWLKNDANGCVEDPPVTLYTLGRRAWRHERAWPIEHARTATWWLDAGALATTAPGRSEAAEYMADPTVGTASGRWDADGGPAEQVIDDVRSLSYTSVPLPEATEITGAPTAILRVSGTDDADAMLVVRLCDVAASGRSQLITSGWCRLDLRRASRPTVVRLGTTSYLVPAGHRLRLSIACSDFPHLWPTPTNPRIRVHHGPDGSKLELPLIEDGAADAAIPAAPRRPDRPAPQSTVRRLVEHDLVDDAVAVTTAGRTRLATGSGDHVDVEHRSIARVERSHPEAARVESTAGATMRTPTGGTIEIRARSWTSRARLAMWGRVVVDGATLFERTWRFGAIGAPARPGAVVTLRDDRPARGAVPAESVRPAAPSQGPPR